MSILLILLIIFNAGGYFFAYYQLENYFKQIAFNRIDDYISIEKLEKIELDNKSLFKGLNGKIKMINDREILYNGKMYDIYMIEIQNGKSVFYCVSDENEDIIHNAFIDYLNENNNKNDVKSVTNIIKIFITLALMPNHTNFNRILFYNNLSLSYNISYKKIIIDTPSPPPKNIS